MTKKIVIVSVIALFIFIIGKSNSFAAFDVVPFGGARAIGIGGAMTSVVDNNNAIFYNPSAVEFNNSHYLLAGYNEGNNSIQNVFSYSYKITENDLISIGYNRSSFGGTGEAESDITIISYAHKINDQLNIGLSGQRSHYDSAAVIRVATPVNVGLNYFYSKYISFGLIVSNINKTSTSTLETLPTAVTFGATIDLPPSSVPL